MYNTLVIGADEEVGVRVSVMDGKEKSNLDCDEFGPTNIPAVFFPGSFEFPGIPLLIEDDTNAPGG